MHTFQQVFPKTFPGDEVGLHTWTASITLAELILENHEKFSNQKVLELGAGSAVPSIIAALYTEVTASDATEVDE